MPTNKNRVQSYLSDDVMDNLKTFAHLQGLSISSAIERLLIQSLSSKDANRSSFDYQYLMFQNRVNSRLQSLEKNTKLLLDNRRFLNQ